MFSSSFILIKVQTNVPVVGILANKTLKRQNTFLSLDFYDESKTQGELHFSKSYESGRMELINFTRVEDIFVLFTSSPQNYVYFSEIMQALNTGLSTEMLRLPMNSVPNFGHISEMMNFSIDKDFGVSALVKVCGKRIFLKIYTNGLVTYTMTDEEEIILRLIQISLSLIVPENDTRHHTSST